MFDWLKPKGQQVGAKKPRTITTGDDVKEVLAQYGELLEKYPTAYKDETWLPVPKDQMRLAFKFAWKFAPNAELRNAVVVGWTHLHWFQPGVGQTPIECKFPEDPRSKDPRDVQAMAQVRRWQELSKISHVEMERDFAEMETFIRSNR